MKRILLAVIFTLLAGHAAHAEDTTRKCILNTPEIPQYNFKRTFGASFNKDLFQEEIYAYVVLKIRGEAGKKVVPIDVVSTTRPGWDKVATLLVSAMTAKGSKTEHLPLPGTRVHVIFYFYQMTGMAMIVADNSIDLVKRIPFTPEMIKSMFAIAKANAKTSHPAK